MKNILSLAVVFLALFVWTGITFSQNPFTSKTEARKPAPEPVVKSTFIAKTVVWQYRLKQKMSDLIQDIRNDGDVRPLLLLMGVAFGYGAIHAAGPGHGKAVAASYVLSHKPSPIGGVLFGLLIALIHGSSGIVGVIGLRYFIERGFNDTLTSITTVTQAVSFGLISILGLGIFFKHCYSLFIKSASRIENPSPMKTVGSLLPWAAAVGLVPCPAVVMVMLFCLSMDAMILGLCTSICVVLGMGTTICLVVVTVIFGKGGILQIPLINQNQTVEKWLGLFSGAAISFFGIIFFIASLSAFDH